MISVSETFRDSAIEKPSPDVNQAWYRTATTQWMLCGLKIDHQEALESLAAICMNNSERDLENMYKIQAMAEIIENLIDRIEGCNDV